MTTRNEELHTGLASFNEISGSSWHASYYTACDALLTSLGSDLEYFLGADEAAVATKVIKAAADESAKEVIKATKDFSKKWSKLPQAEKTTLSQQALVWASKHVGHRVPCPACGSAAIVIGSAAGPPVHSVKDGIVTEKQHMLPTRFECVACGLKIARLSRLMAAGLGDGFTGTATYDVSDTQLQEPEYEEDFNEM